MKYYTLHTRKAIDGFDAVVDVFPESACWASLEEDAITLVLQKLAWFLDLPSHERIRVEFSRKEDEDRWYRITIR